VKFRKIVRIRLGIILIFAGFHTILQSFISFIFLLAIHILIQNLFSYAVYKKYFKERKDGNFYEKVKT